MPDSSRIKLKKGDFELEVEGDKEFATAKFEELLSKNINLPSSPLRSQTTQSGMTDTNRQLSLGEFYRQKKSIVIVTKS